LAPKGRILNALKSSADNNLSGVFVPEPFIVMGFITTDLPPAVVDREYSHQ
jgi:hypothetical protein